MFSNFLSSSGSVDSFLTYFFVLIIFLISISILNVFEHFYQCCFINNSQHLCGVCAIVVSQYAFKISNCDGRWCQSSAWRRSDICAQDVKNIGRWTQQQDGGKL